MAADHSSQCAREAWPKRKEVAPETSESSPGVRVPTAQGGGHQAEASLARSSGSTRATVTAKRRQRACGPWDRAPKDGCGGGRRRCDGGRRNRHAKAQGRGPGPQHGGSIGVKGHGTQARAAQEPGRSRCLPVQPGTAARGKASTVGATRSRSAAVGAMKPGNRPEGPGRAKGGAGIRNRARERWERRRAHQPS
jgi:hypothetical protein